MVPTKTKVGAFGCPTRLALPAWKGICFKGKRRSSKSVPFERNSILPFPPICLNNSASALETNRLTEDHLEMEISNLDSRRCSRRNRKDRGNDDTLASWPHLSESTSTKSTILVTQSRFFA